MSNSVQTAVSNGSLTLLDISFNYFDRTHVHVYFDNVEQTLGTTWSWAGSTDKRIQFSPAVSSGVVVKVKRVTPLDSARHVYSSPGNAPFNKATVDENFQQTLYASQEAQEGASLEQLQRDLDAQGNKITDLGDALLDGDAVNLKVLREYLPYGPAATSLAARIIAEEAVTAKVAAQGILQGTLVITGFDGTDTPDNAWVHFAGRDTVGDGGGGPLRFLKGSTATADGVTIYAVTGGRLVREGWSSFGINPKWAGAKGGGEDDSDAFALFLTAIVDRVGRVPRGTYKITQPLALTGSSTALICEPGTVFDFYLPDHASDCFTLNPVGYEPLHVENLTINCNNTGRDGLAFSKGAPKMRNIVINQPYRDGIGITINSANYSWVENWTCDGTLLITAAGRHALHTTLTGAWNGTPFFNETLLEQFEVRGVGRNFAHAGAIRFTFDGTTAAPVSGFTVLQCNFDAQVANAVGPVSHTIYAQSVNGGVGSVESLYIKGGGWESTSGVAPGGLYNYNADATIATKLSCIVGVVNYNWAYNVCPSFAAEKSNHYTDANGAHYASALQKSDGYAFKAASGGYLGGFTNNPTAYRTRSFLVASGNATVDIPIGVMSDYSAQAPLVVTIFHKGFYDSLGFYGYGVYLVSPSRTNVDYVHSVVMLSGSSNDAYSFTPAAVTFSIPSSGTLRVTVPGGASVGTSGTSAAFDIAANRMFVDLPGVVTGLTL